MSTLDTVTNIAAGLGWLFIALGVGFIVWWMRQ